ncbi:MAG: hypothetical protein RSF82_09225 [Angelakisella sp.]
MLDMFSTREVSIGIWLIILVLFLLIYRPTRKYVADILKTTFSMQLSIPFLLMIGYTVGITYFFSKMPLWRAIYIKDIATWVIFVGIPMFFGSLNKKSEEHYLKKVVQNNFKLTVLVEFLISTFTLPLIWEILLIPLMILLFMLDTVATTDSQYRPAKKLISFVIIAINIVFIIEIISEVTRSFNTLNKNIALIHLAIPIVFSILYIPISYLFAVFGKYQTIFIQMGFKESKCHSNIKLIHRFKVVWSCGFSLIRLEKFEKEYMPNMFANMDETDFEDLVHNFRIKSSAKNPLKKNETAKKTLIDEIKESNFQEAIKYINAHIGMFTLLATFCLGLLSVIIKGFLYVFMCGKFDYWGIDHSYINISNENLLYEIVLYAAIAVIFIAFNLAPFKILTSEHDWYIKLFKTIMLVLITSCIVIVILLVYVFIFNGQHLAVLKSVKLSLVICTLPELMVQLMPVVLIMYLPGMFMSFPWWIAKKEVTTRTFIHKFFNGSTIIPLIIGLSVYLIMAYVSGRNDESAQKTFKTIGENSVVIYEDVEHYIVSDCTIMENQIIIYNTKQKLISKESIETTTIIFKVAEQKKP